MSVSLRFLSDNSYMGADMYERLQTVTNTNRLKPDSFQAGVLHAAINFLEEGINAELKDEITDISEITKAIFEHLKTQVKIKDIEKNEGRYARIGLLTTYKDFLERTADLGPLSQTQVNVANQLTQFFYCLGTAESIFYHHPVVRHPTAKEIMSAAEDDE